MSPSQVDSPPRIGMLLGSGQTPSEFIPAAQATARGRFDEIWVGEDYFFTGGIAAAGAALAHTSLPVGIGITPMATRHPALLAMELATLEGLYPGRLMAGIGVGVPEWLDQMGVRPDKPLSDLKDIIGAVRALLSGDSLTTSNASFRMQEVKLEHPPHRPPPVYAGVGGPRALEAAGSMAHGVILSVLAGEDYVRWARERIRIGGGTDQTDVVTYAFVSMDPDARRSRDRLRELFGFYLLAGPRNPMTDAYGIADEAEELARLPFEEAISQLPDQWMDDLAIVGDAQACARKIRSLYAAGANCVCLCPPLGTSIVEEIEILSSQLLPLIRE